MSRTEWFARAHYIYTHAYNLIVIAGLFYGLGRMFGKPEIPHDLVHVIKDALKRRSA